MRLRAVLGLSQSFRDLGARRRSARCPQSYGGFAVVYFASASRRHSIYPGGEERFGKKWHPVLPPITEVPYIPYPAPVVHRRRVVRAAEAAHRRNAQMAAPPLPAAPPYATPAPAAFGLAAPESSLLLVHLDRAIKGERAQALDEVRRARLEQELSLIHI